MEKILGNIIVAATPDAATSSVVVTWANGEMTSHSFRHLLGKGVCVALADSAFFAQVRVGERGRSLAWPDDIDFCADALWLEVHPADTARPIQQHVSG